MEAYINDNIDEIMDGGTISAENNSKYDDRIYATVDKHDSTEPFSMLTCGDEILDSAPVEVRFYYMDNDLGILHTQEYATGEVPYSIHAIEGTACVIVETEWEDFCLEDEGCFLSSTNTR